MALFYEFFCGGGMARAGLGPQWKCVFANDIDEKKAASYAANWGGLGLQICDVADVKTADLPETADLAWASFPCQDLSLAGSFVGLKGDRSGTFWPFWKLMEQLKREGRAPRTIVLENVYGALKSHNGNDFVAIGTALARTGYRFGALVIDAVHFVPQSRPRLFIVAVREDIVVPEALTASGPVPWGHEPGVQKAFDKLPRGVREKWVWWRLPEAPKREVTFGELIEEQPTGVEWHTAQQTARLLRMMSPLNREKLKRAKRSGRRVVGTVYKRTRKDKYGRKAQRAEARFDDVSGCLRTPVGGSSRQIILVVEENRVRSRLLSTREGARLMGLPDSYVMPVNYNEGYHLVGDGVVVPVVRFLTENLLRPLLAVRKAGKRAAA